MDLKKVKLGILGGGAMGEAIIRGIIKAKVFSPAQITVSDLSAQRLKFLKDSYKIKACSDNKKLVSDSGVIIIAVKKQNSFFQSQPALRPMPLQLFCPVTAALSGPCRTRQRECLKARLLCVPAPEQPARTWLQQRKFLPRWGKPFSLMKSLWMR
jgi:predicted dinucleotide-utilizing enzyme